MKVSTNHKWREIEYTADGTPGFTYYGTWFEMGEFWRDTIEGWHPCIDGHGPCIQLSKDCERVKVGNYVRGEE